MQFLNVTVKHERRIRLIFDQVVGIGGFQITSLYTVTNTDGQAQAPNVQAAMIVANSPDVVELQLSLDLVNGAAYQVAAVGVPGPGILNLTVAPSILPFNLGTPTAPVNTTEGITDYDAALYGIDILYSAGDFVEDQNGDLQTVSGSRNVKEALWRRALSEGLPWNNQYGLKAREFVDSSATTLGSLRGRAQEQMLQDNRVASVSTTATTIGAQAFLTIYPTLIGANSVPPLQVPVSPGS